MGARCARFNEDLTLEEQQKQLALFLRYQTTHERAFHRALNDLVKLRAEKRKAKLGFESQERKRNEESRKQARDARLESAEKRKEELHEFAVLLAQAKVTHQQVLTNNLELDQALAGIAQDARQEVKKAA